MIPDTWMNDIGEKIPNWFESARLYYQYSGDPRPLDIVTSDGIDMPLIMVPAHPVLHGPVFHIRRPMQEIRFSVDLPMAKRLVLHEVQVDHAGDMGFTYYKLFLITGNEKFKKAAIQVADALAAHARVGSASAVCLALPGGDE